MSATTNMYTYSFLYVCLWSATTNHLQTCFSSWNIHSTGLSLFEVYIKMVRDFQETLPKTGGFHFVLVLQLLVSALFSRLIWIFSSSSTFSFSSLPTVFSYGTFPDLSSEKKKPPKFIFNIWFWNFSFSETIPTSCCTDSIFHKMFLSFILRQLYPYLGHFDRRTRWHLRARYPDYGLRVFLIVNSRRSAQIGWNWRDHLTNCGSFVCDRSKHLAEFRENFSRLLPLKLWFGKLAFMFPFSYAPLL